MHSPGIEPAIPADEQLQNYALDRTAAENFFKRKALNTDEATFLIPSVDIAPSHKDSKYNVFMQTKSFE
jgi:hypothetical protein